MLRAVLFVMGGIAPRSLTDPSVLERCPAPWPPFPLTSHARQGRGAPRFSHPVLGWRQRGSQLCRLSVASVLVHLYCSLPHTHPHLLDKFLPAELLDQRIGTFKILVDDS